MAYDVFVSYRWVEPDQSWVREELVPALKQAGLSVCLDVEDFVPGRDLIAEMTRAGTESRRALCVISPEYFDGNRMVGFESLMARRFDPSGSESRLVPLVVRNTEMPEWMRGLIPLDWTDVRDHQREWRKLLKVLGAAKLTAPEPGPVSAGLPSRGRNSRPPREQVQIVRVSKLTPREGVGVGYELTIKNDGRNDAFVKSTQLSGRIEVMVSGFIASNYRSTYSIELEAVRKSDEEGQHPLESAVYDQADQDWGVRCQGVFKYSFSDNRVWQYDLSIPTPVRIPANDRAGLRLLFRRKQKALVEEAGHASPAYASYGVSHREFSIRMVLESDEIISSEADEGILELLSNWQTTT